MGKRSIQFKRIDDEGVRVYELIETHTIRTVIRIFDQSQYEIELEEVDAYNKDNSAVNLLKKQIGKITKEEAQQRLIATGMLYSDGTVKEYYDDGEQIPLSVLKVRREQEKGQ